MTEKDPRRLFSPHQRELLYLTADGICECPGCRACTPSGCERPLEPGWHADHLRPHSKGGLTKLTNGAAKCPPCNQEKAAKMDDRAIAYGWQDDLLREYLTADAPRYLVAAWTGLGKTRAGAKICAAQAQALPDLSVIVLCPSDDIAKGWRKALHEEGLHLRRVGKDQNDRTVAGRTCACGVPATALVMTYQFCAAHPYLLLREVRKPHALHLDESHHLRRGSADRAGWITPLRMASELMASAKDEGIYGRVVSYSATPLRTDEEPVPWIHTKDAASDEIDPLPDRWTYTRTYGQALTQRGPRPVTPVVFERFTGDVEWAEEGDEDNPEVTHRKRISDKHAKHVERKVRRYAVDGRGGWLRDALKAASAKRDELGLDHPSAALLVIGRHTDHAIAMADIQVSQDRGPVFVYTNDYMTDDHRPGNGWADANGKRPGHRPELADQLIDRFREGSAPSIVSVKKLAEGIDIDRLRVLVYATTVATWLAFVQAVGRVLRTCWTLPLWLDQCAWVFILDDRTMSGYAAVMEDEQIEASLADEEDEEDESGKKKPPVCGGGGQGRAVERFIGSTSEYAGATVSGQHLDAELMALASKAGLSGTELPALHKIWEAGLLWSQDGPGDTASPEVAYGDPETELRTAKKEKNEAVSNWATARRRSGEFAGPQMMGDSYAACHGELGDLFGVWKDSADVTIEQVRKAGQWAKEQTQAIKNRAS